MNFSESFKLSNFLCAFSPSGEFVANASQYRLVVRELKTLQIVNLYTCIDVIQHLEWSSDSQFVLCGLFKRGVVQVWSLEEPKWTCKIDEGSAGLTAVRWSPDSRHILTMAEFNLRITVWSLTNKNISYIKYPKGIMDFSRDGHYLGLAERRDCKDYISIFDCRVWQMCKHFPVDTTDLAGLSWSPDGRVIVVWDSPLYYKVLIYSPDGRCLGAYSAYEEALGIKTVCWSSSSQFCAVGSYDEKVAVLNQMTWRPLTEFKHRPMFAPSASTVVYREVELTPPMPAPDISPPIGKRLFRQQSKYEVVTGSVCVPSVRPDPEKPNPRLGIGLLAFSLDSRYLATRNDNMPCAVWIWDMTRLKLAALLQHTSPVRCFHWSPVTSELALCTNTNRVFLWSASGCVVTDVPLDIPFQVARLEWCADGKALCLMTRDRFCVCFLNSSEEL